MKRTPLAKGGPPALDLIEEAFYCLRQLPLSAFLAYLTCTLPLMFGFLFFWADMSTRPDAEKQVPAWIVQLAFLFLFAKLGQSVLSHSLTSVIRGQPPTPWNLRRILRTLGIHLALQPIGLFLLPISLIIVIPTAWVVAYFQTATVLASEPDVSRSDVSAEARKQTFLWSSQNQAIVLLLSTLAFFVFLNLLLLAFLGPQMLRSLLGVETVFTQSPWSLLNSTVLASLAGLTLLAMDPVFKAVYALRSFRARSLQSGEDLLVTLRRLRAAKVSLWIMMALWIGSATGASPADTVEPPKAPAVAPGAIHRAAESTLQKRDYLWRLPRDKALESPGKPGDFWSRFWTSVGESFRNAMNSVEKVMQKFGDWMRKILGSKDSPSRSHFLFDWGSPISVLSKLVILALLIVVGVLIYRLWRTHQSTLVTATTAPSTPSVDLNSESVHAAELPEDEWLRLAAELRESGDLRLALRALYFATLAHLAQRGLLSLSRFKSNRDYQRDLYRRAHALPMLFADFSENLAAFERVWYGNHELAADSFETFALTFQRIQAQATG